MYTFTVVLRPPRTREMVEKVLGEGVLVEGYMLRYDFTNQADYHKARIEAEKAKFWIKFPS